mmetsp:Transcript_16758/g.37191  ORF Transcript_16758/g.37191 Transcript_16758/m.37191 type:complete len:211 (+) Transcript_16758:422-1054(+)
MGCVASLSSSVTVSVLLAVPTAASSCLLRVATRATSEGAGPLDSAAEVNTVRPALARYCASSLYRMEATECSTAATSSLLEQFSRPIHAPSRGGSAAAPSPSTSCNVAREMIAKSASTARPVTRISSLPSSQQRAVASRKWRTQEGSRRASRSKRRSDAREKTVPKTRKACAPNSGSGSLARTPGTRAVPVPGDSVPGPTQLPQEVATSQ